MNLIVGVRFLSNDRNSHRECVKVTAQLMWEHFLANLIYTYKTKKKKSKKTEINIYVSKMCDKGKIYHLFEYVIPLKLVDYYGREEFKSILPRGSMVDLVESVNPKLVDPLQHYE